MTSLILVNNKWQKMLPVVAVASEGIISKHLANHF